MDKKRIIGIILGVLLVLAMSLKFYLDYKDNKDNETKEPERVATEDGKKFKSEYESLNGTEITEDIKYLSLDISEFNPVVYKTDEEIVEILNNGTGVIYFGFNACPWCRSMIETLLEVVEDNNIEELYYTDIKDIRSSFEVKNKKLNVVKEGTESYYDILEKLDEYLSDYIITDNKKEYDTKEKRLYAPTVVVVKEGEIVGVHEVTVDSQTEPYDGLNEDQKKELYNIYDEMISKINNGTCNKTGC